MKKLTQDEVLLAFKEVHGCRYGYSKFIYMNSSTKSTIICSEHGEFEMTYKNHIHGQGCRKCGAQKSANDRKLPVEELIERSNKMHNFKYDYSKVDYIRSSDKITIICPKHGEFQQIASHHMSGHGCSKCNFEVSPMLQKMTQDEYHEKIVGVHGDRFDYSLMIYKGNDKPIDIICKKHGVFSQRANDHLSKKAGCPTCAGVKRYTTKDFAEIGRERHEGKYTYEKVEYVKTDVKVIITCPKHGDFSQLPHDHLQGAGCPTCGGSGKSKGETEVDEFIKALGFVTEVKNRQIIKPYELDVVIPEIKVAIEYNGLYYHSDKFERIGTHKVKTDKATEAGYRLLHIYEDDWRDRRPIVEKTIKHILGLSEEHLFARKLKLVKKSFAKCKEFYETNHLQGSGRGDSWCLMSGEDIVAAMQFSMSSSERGNTDATRWELIRFASSVRVVGGASKLFKAFLKDNPEVKTVISYSDNDMFGGGMYENLGFIKDSDVKPDYKVVVGDKRVHKSNFRKSKIAKYYPEVYDDTLSEREMCEKLGYYRIYNSGLTKWVWERP